MISLPNTRQRMSLGFTLVELLVVISIVILLMSLMLPALSKARASAVIIQCASNLRGVGVGIGVYLLDHRERMMTFTSGQSVYPLAAVQSSNHVALSYSRSLWPDSTRGCPNVLASTKMDPVAYNWGPSASGLTGNLLEWGYQLPAVNVDTVSMTGGSRIVDAHPNLVLSADTNYEYIRLIDGEVAKDRNGDVWVYGSKRWDPNGTKALASDMISYSSGSGGRLVAGHMSGGGAAKRLIGPSLPVAQVPQLAGVTGGNQLWHDFHVWWQPFNGPPTDDYRRIATGAFPQGMTADTTSRMYYYFAKPSRRIE